jgi:hypothetical protein
MFQVDNSIIISYKFVISCARFSLIPIQARAEGNREWINQVNFSFAQSSHWMIALAITIPVT